MFDDIQVCYTASENGSELIKSKQSWNNLLRQYVIFIVIVTQGARVINLHTNLSATKIVKKSGMSVKYSLKVLLICCLLVSVLPACNTLPDMHIARPTSSIPIGYAGSTPPQLNTWNQWAPGVELRYERWQGTHKNEDIVTIARFDLHHIHLSVGYQPNQPLPLRNWMQQTNALAVINGGFFDAQKQAVALLVSNGQTYGTSYSGFGGMLSVDNQGNVLLRSLRDQPYDPDTEQLEQATQASPMLMIASQRTHFQADASARRWSVVAMDKQGRLLFIVSPSMTFSLDELADLLASSDLSLYTAMNLDGGSSTGLYMNNGNQKVTIDALTFLPIVIIIK